MQKYYSYHSSNNRKLFLAHCKAGNFLHLETNICEPCGYGFYQPSSGSFTCIPCGVGKTTLSNQATSEDECRDECPDGEHLTVSGTCQPCPLGTYRTKGVHKKCVDCPPGTTTENIRSTKRLQCNTPKCVAGQFLVTARYFFRENISWYSCIFLVSNASSALVEPTKMSPYKQHANSVQLIIQQEHLV